MLRVLTILLYVLAYTTGSADEVDNTFAAAPKLACRKIKCSSASSPSCIRINSTRDGHEKKHVYMRLESACELDYLKCQGDVDFKVLKLEECDRRHKKEHPKRKLRSKRSIRQGGNSDLESQSDPASGNLVNSQGSSAEGGQALQKLYGALEQSESSGSDSGGSAGPALQKLPGLVSGSSGSDSAGSAGQQKLPGPVEESSLSGSDSAGSAGQQKQSGALEQSASSGSDSAGNAGPQKLSGTLEQSESSGSDSAGSAGLQKLSGALEQSASSGSDSAGNAGQQKLSGAVDGSSLSGSDSAGIAGQQKLAGALDQSSLSGSDSAGSAGQQKLSGALEESASSGSDSTGSADNGAKKLSGIVSDNRDPIWKKIHTLNQKVDVSGASSVSSESGNESSNDAKKLSGIVSDDRDPEWKKIHTLNQEADVSEAVSGESESGTDQVGSGSSVLSKTDEVGSGLSVVDKTDEVESGLSVVDKTDEVGSGLSVVDKTDEVVSGLSVVDKTDEVGAGSSVVDETDEGASGSSGGQSSGNGNISKMKKLDDLLSSGEDIVQYDGRDLPKDYDLPGVNKKLKDASCPTTCQTRAAMVCARCKDNVYRTFMSVCHMRAFICQHPEEHIVLVANRPCAMSAPYMPAKVNSVKGPTDEPADDTILHYILCRDRFNKRLKPIKGNIPCRVGIKDIFVRRKLN